MLALRMGFPSLAGFNNPDLLQAPVVLFDLLTRLGKLQQSQFIHLQIVDSLVLCRTNLGNDLKSPCNSSQDVLLSGCRNVAIPNGHSWSCHHLACHRSRNRTEPHVIDKIYLASVQFAQNRVVQN